MRILALIALAAATATPALASTDTAVQFSDSTYAARDIADRAQGYEISELSQKERNANALTKARDIADRAQGYEISELSQKERNANALTKARDIADRAQGYEIG